MGKRNKKNRQRQAQEAVAEAEPEEELVQCPTCDAMIKAGLPGCPQCGQEFIVDGEDTPEPETAPAEEEIPAEEELPQIAEPEPDTNVSVEEPISDLDEEFEDTAIPEEIPADAGVTARREEPIDDEDEDEGGEESQDDEPPRIKLTLLIIGTLLASASVLGVVLLRYGVIQTMFGYTASPGIGSQELMAILGSIAPFAIGLFLIGIWGVKNDQIYQKTAQIKKASEKESTKPRKYVEEPDEAEYEPTESIPATEVPEPAYVPIIAEEPRVEYNASKPISMKEVPEEFTEPMDELEDELKVDNTSTPETEEDIQLEQLLEDVMVDIEDDKGPEITSSALKEALADSLRAERCEKMLRAIVVLPDDKDRLKALIGTGISPSEFSDEVSKAVDRRKKKEKSREVTAEEKAAILEDELVAELSELEDGFDKKDESDDDDLEDQILKEIEDLEDL